ncbi:hypothetical protein ONZ45_g12203 [Pleurotus djamor]|nr:hypothetical protein ONZ45_g12203 [Pleurotus djamor]
MSTNTSRARVQAFKAAMSSGDFAAMFESISDEALIVEHGPPAHSLPFLGTEFRGHTGLRNYIDALSEALDIFEWEYVEICEMEGGAVFVTGKGDFGSKKTGKRWTETFVSRFELDKETKIIKYETWADPLSAYLASQPDTPST